MFVLDRSIRLTRFITTLSKCHFISCLSVKADVEVTARQSPFGLNACNYSFLYPSVDTFLRTNTRRFSIGKIAMSNPLCTLTMSSAETKVGPLSPNDPSSFSNPEDVRADRIRLNWNIDFERKVISGSAIYELVVNNASVPHIIFDTKDISVHGVTDVSTGDKLDFSLGERVSTFGEPLKVTLPAKKNNQKVEIQIHYETAANKCSALQWLDKEQTAGKECPYLFSQCEAIHARSLVPCQDSPSTKASYHAEVTAPKEIQVLMSAVRSGQPEDVDSNLCKHSFEQKVPIPSYLIAIVAGKIASKRIGPRSEVWAEPQFLEAAAYEFEDTEKMIKAGENVCGEYVWGTYDILVLPPSFPFGGMENPCLTFATPTLLAGDKSLANVIAHEIAHSWTGNLVTNRTFEHFWLNEGFTVFTERKILQRLEGEPARQFASIGGLKDLKECINTMKPDNPLTALVPKLDGVDPDDSFSTVPYEKGYAFLYYLEEKVGGPDVFEPFLKTYIATNRYKSIATNDFKWLFIDYFTNEGKLKLIKDVEWDKWLNTPGMPLVVSEYDTSLLQPCTDLKDRWVKWDESTASPFEKGDLDKLSSPQKIEFLAELLEENSLSVEKLKAIQQAYDLNAAGNSEIRFRWLRLCIKGKWVEQLPLSLKFVTEQGRMKFVRPLYRDMYAWEEARSQAIDTFQKNRSSMMYVSAYTVSKDLHLA